MRDKYRAKFYYYVNCGSYVLLIYLCQALAFWPTSKRKPLSIVVKREGADDMTHAFPANVPQRTLLPVDQQVLAIITAIYLCIALM